MGELLRDLRYGLRGLVRNPGLAAVAAATLTLGIGATTSSPANFLDWKARSVSFEDVAGFVRENFNVTHGDHPTRVRGAAVTPESLRGGFEVLDAL